MRIKSESFKQINRKYLVTSKQIKENLGIKGEIVSIGLNTGRSPKDIEEGVSADTDEWYINTIEKKSKEAEK